MRNKHAMAALTLACAVVWPLAALGEASATPADEAPRVDVVPTAVAKQAANELMRLQEDTLILKAQLKKLDAQTQVFERQETLNRIGSTVSSYSDISLVATQSLGKRVGATVATSGGSESDVTTGDTLPNGMRVAAIRPGAIVLVAPDGHRTTLSVSVNAQDPVRTAAQIGTQAAARGVPPIPTLPLPTR
jgi:type IV pilus biogenesis protein PilP